MDTSPHGNNAENQNGSVPDLVWDQPLWDAFLAEVQSAPTTFNANGLPIDAASVSPLSHGQDVEMNGVVEDWLHESAFQQHQNSQTWQYPNPQVPSGTSQNALFPPNSTATMQKSINTVFPGNHGVPIPYQESPTDTTADGGRSRTSSNLSSHGDYLSPTDTPGQQSTVASHPSSPKAAPLQCHLCPKQFTRALNLRQHLRGHSTERPYVCKICDRSFARLQDRKRHEVFHSEVSTPSDSPVMSRQNSMTSMNSANSAASSAASRRGPRIAGGYPCRQCDRVFDVPSDLAQHERNHKPKEQRPHACPHCDERFLYPKDLGRHIRRKHKDAADSAGLSIDTAPLPTAQVPDTNNEATASGSKQAEALPSFESIERVDHFSPSVTSSQRNHQSPPANLYQNSDDPLESLAEVITGIPPGLRNMLFASMHGTEQDLKVRLAKVWLGGIEVLLKTKMKLSDEQAQRTNQALDQLVLDLDRLEMQGGGGG